MGTISLTKLSTELLDQARAANSGRAAHTLHGGHDTRLRQTMIALVAGQELAEHASPEEATLHVITGKASLTTATGSTEASAGKLLTIPSERHALVALEDTVVLLTVLAR
ncbi:MAG: LuxR family transcriptional regulator [Actinobacteria bacterium]|nr:LuxR family transcriptional regulator [Actinomycetota bacterium]